MPENRFLLILLIFLSLLSLTLENYVSSETIHKNKQSHDHLGIINRHHEQRNQLRKANQQPVLIDSLSVNGSGSRNYSSHVRFRSGKGDNHGLRVLMVSIDDREIKGTLDGSDYVSIAAVLQNDYCKRHGYACVCMHLNFMSTFYSPA